MGEEYRHTGIQELGGFGHTVVWTASSPRSEVASAWRQTGDMGVRRCSSMGFVGSVAVGGVVKDFL